MVYTDRAQACSTGGPYALASKWGHGKDRQEWDKDGIMGMREDTHTLSRKKKEKKKTHSPDI